MEQKKEIVLIVGHNRHIIHAVAESLVQNYHIVLLSNIHPQEHSKIDHRFFNLAHKKDLENILSQLHEDYGNKLNIVIYLSEEGVGRFMRSIEKFFHVDQLITSSTFVAHPEFKVASLDIRNVYDDEGHSSLLESKLRKTYEHKFISSFLPFHLFQYDSFLHLEDLIFFLHRLIEIKDELPDFIALKLGERMSHADIQNTLNFLVYKNSWHRHVPHLLEKIMRRLGVDATDDVNDEWKSIFSEKPQKNLKTSLPQMMESFPGHQHPSHSDRIINIFRKIHLIS